MGGWICAYRDVSSGEALYVRDDGHYADLVEVTDLDSAAGADGMLLVEQGSTSIEYAGRLAAQRERFRATWNSCGPESPLAGMGREQARVEAYRALWVFGHRDVERSEVLTVGDAPRIQDGWIATDSVDDLDELPGYLEREFDIPRGLGG
jgi:hypothetical protein